MSQFDQQWQRLTALARQAPADQDTTVPTGFATRVVAQAASTPVDGPWPTLERLALRGFLAAAACSLAAVAFNYLGSTPELPEDAGLDETMSVLLDLS